MAEKYNDDYDAANKALIQRESMKHERAKARVESLEANMTKGLAAALKASRTAIAKEAVNQVNRGEANQLSPTELAMIDAAKKGIDRVQIDEGIITGQDMPSYLRADYDDEE